MQQENGKRVTRLERSLADVVSQGKVRKARVFMRDSIIRSVDRVVDRGDEITVCLPGAKIEDVAGWWHGRCCSCACGSKHSNRKLKGVQMHIQRNVHHLFRKINLTDIMYIKLCIHYVYA